MRKNENAGGGTLKNLKNPIPLLLALSLVSCHPAMALPLASPQAIQKEAA